MTDPRFTPHDPDPAPQPPAAQPAAARRLPWVRILGTLLSLALLVMLIRAQGWEEFTQVLGRLPAQTFWIALGLMFGSRVCVALRWYTLLRFAEARISLWQTLRLVFMGLFASNFLPTTIGGDLVRMAGAVALRVDPGVSAASLVLDRLIGMAGMTALAPFGLAMVAGGSRGAAGTGSFQPTFVLVGAALAAKKLPGIEWVKKQARQFFGSIRRSSGLWLKRPASLLLALLCTFGHMLFTFLVIAVFLEGIHEPLSLWRIGALWSLSYFITLVPVSINGLGLQELSISLLYVTFGGVSPEAALVLALFMRMVQMLASLPGALFLPEILRPLTGRKPAATETREA